MERSESKSDDLMDKVVMKPLRLSGLISCFQQVLGVDKKRQPNRRKVDEDFSKAKHYPFSHHILFKKLSYEFTNINSLHIFYQTNSYSHAST